MKVLCVCPIGLGNYLLTYPACALLKRADPSIELHLLALREYIRDVAAGDTLWHTVHVIDPTKLKDGFYNIFKLLAALRREQFDASLNFFASNDIRYNLLPFLCNVPKRYGFAYHIHNFTRGGWLCTLRAPVDAQLHDIRQNITLANTFLGRSSAAADPVRFPVLCSDDDITFAQSYFTSLSVNPVRIAIHAGSSAENGMDAKRWGSERFAALADAVCGHLNGEAYLFGGNDEASIKQNIKNRMKAPVHIVDQCSLRKTAALLQSCTLCICNDSGLMHLSACQNVPTAALFGPTDEKRNGPWGDKTIVLRKPMPGFPVWHAANVGDRRLPRGVDPQASLNALMVDDAWAQLKPWIDRGFNSHVGD